MFFCPPEEVDQEFVTGFSPLWLDYNLQNNTAGEWGIDCESALKPMTPDIRQAVLHELLMGCINKEDHQGLKQLLALGALTENTSKITRAVWSNTAYEGKNLTANLMSTDSTALLDAAAAGNSLCVQYLLQAGADIHRQKQYKKDDEHTSAPKSALEIACRYDHAQNASLLMDAHERDGNRGVRPQFLLNLCAMVNCVKTCALVVERYASELNLNEAIQAAQKLNYDLIVQIIKAHQAKFAAFDAISQLAPHPVRRSEAPERPFI